MVYWFSKLSLSFKYSVSLTTLAKNLNCFGLKFCNFRLSTMDSVNEAAKGWSNPEISKIYEKTRPNYNADCVEFLLEKVGALKPHPGPEPCTIVELGAGTGKFTRAVLKLFEDRKVQNCKIIATEPLKEMCETFSKMVPNVEIMQCPASDLSGECRRLYTLFRSKIRQEVMGGLIPVTDNQLITSFGSTLLTYLPGVSPL